MPSGTKTLSSRLPILNRNALLVLVDLGGGRTVEVLGQDDGQWRWPACSALYRQWSDRLSGVWRQRASNNENTIPDKAATTMDTVTMAKAGSELGSTATVRTPPRPPMTMMPSSAMLMMPECSLNMPPRATSIRTMPYNRVYLISSSMSFALLFGLCSRLSVGVRGVGIHVEFLFNHAAEQHSEGAQVDDDAGNQVGNLGGEIAGGQETAAPP